MTTSRGLFSALVLVVLGIHAQPLRAQFEWTSSRPDGHAPIGVMGEHTHTAGEWMLAYRLMRMSMDGNRTGTEDVSTESVLANFMVAPQDMSMDMHMLGAMYAPSDRLTLMLMAPFNVMSMNHVTRMGGSFATESVGLGDVSIGGLIGIKRTGWFRAHLNASISLPTGSIEQMDETPMSMGNPVQLPYPMQIGTGTLGVRPGLTLLGMGEKWSFGLQGLGRVPLGENSRGYSVGSGGETTAWLALRLTQSISLSVRGLYRTWGDYSGHDEAFGNPMVVPTVREDLRGGKRFDVPFGINLYFPDGALAGHRFAFEFHLPVYQDLNGPQLATDWQMTIGWQKSFAAPQDHDH